MLLVLIGLGYLCYAWFGGFVDCVSSFVCTRLVASWWWLFWMFTGVGNCECWGTDVCLCFRTMVCDSYCGLVMVTSWICWIGCSCL